jgi:hypothetical protein
MSRAIDPTDAYPLKVAKLLPAEVTAAYFAINGYLNDNLDNQSTLVVFGAVLAVICFFLIRWQTNNSLQAALTSFAFVLWAANISANDFATENTRIVLACVLVIASLVLPRIITPR